MADDTAKLQKLLDVGGLVLIPAGVYWVDPTKSLRPVSNSEIRLDGVTLKVIPNDESYYATILVTKVENVKIYGGTIVGDREKHTYGGDSTHEWGMGIRVQDGAKNITITKTVAKDLTGDGFYIGAKDILGVSLLGVVSDNNRRQGLSIVGGSKIVVADSTFSNTNGTRPSDGIDIEPDKDDVVSNVRVTNCVFKNNTGVGFEVHGKRGKVTDVRMTGCKFSGNQPTKINYVPEAKQFEVDVWGKLKGRWLGDWSAYKTEVIIK